MKRNIIITIITFLLVTCIAYVFISRYDYNNDCCNFMCDCVYEPNKSAFLLKSICISSGVSLLLFVTLILSTKKK